MVQGMLAAGVPGRRIHLVLPPQSIPSCFNNADIEEAVANALQNAGQYIGLLMPGFALLQGFLETPKSFKKFFFRSLSVLLIPELVLLLHFLDVPKIFKFFFRSMSFLLISGFVLLLKFLESRRIFKFFSRALENFQKSVLTTTTSGNLPKFVKCMTKSEADPRLLIVKWFSKGEFN